MSSGSVMTLWPMLLLLTPLHGITATGRDNVTETTKSMDVMVMSEEQRTETTTIMEVHEAQETQVKSNVTTSNRTESAFMPSLHLGPIIAVPELFPKDRQPVKSPFNNVEPNKRGNSLFNSVRAIQFNNGQPENEVQQQHRKDQRPQPPFRPSEEDANFVKFVDDNGNDEQPHRHEFSNSNTQGKGGVYKNVADTRHGEPPIHEQQVVAYVDENYDGGQQHQYLTYEAKPTSKFHEAPAYGLPYQQALMPGEHAYAHQYHQTQQEPYLSDEHQKLVQPETVINVHPVSYQTTSYDPLTNPKTVVYVSNHDTMRNRKHPFSYYQPQVFEHTETAPVTLPEHSEPYPYPVFFEPQHKNISPWKKILHIIGAFLPLGLLLALLSPRVINAESTSDPNIILSKLRVNDLPAEHKNNRFTSSQTKECEERSICKLINAADPSSANFLKHLLVHVAERTPEAAVRKKELDRIFEAAKLGNCDILTCNFYDGT